jgi:cell division protein FtsN
MSKAYKYRASEQKKSRSKNTVSWGKVLLVFILVVLFVGFLVFLNNSSPEEKPPQHNIQKVVKKEPEEKPKPKAPVFTFYKILPETEVFVPSHEIDTRNREENIGKGQATNYLIQVGSFSQYEKANNLKRDLAMMGIESTIEKINLDGVVWNRLVIGPYSGSSNVAKLTKRLRENGIHTKVIEVNQ